MSTSDELLGKTIGGKFRLLEQLDQRGHAFVYRAEQLHVGRPVAVKVARWHPEPDDPALKRLAHAAQVAAQVNHGNVATIYDFGTDGERLVYLAMELCRGRELGEMVTQQGSLPPELVLELGRQILAGLSQAHKMGVVHQTIRPRYVMVEERSGDEGQQEIRVKLLGFGLGDWSARMEVADEGTSKPLSGLSRTAELDASGFAAFEVLQGGTVDHRSDLYSVGVLLYFALTGQLPWPRSAPSDLAARRWFEQSMRRTMDGKPGEEAWIQFFLTALAPDPSRRFDNAGHMLEALERAAAGHSDGVSQVAQLQMPFGRYRLIRMLARGGMGELHLAKTEVLPGLPHVFAVKMLIKELAEKKDFLEKFLNEAKLTSRLSHPNVANVYEVGKVDEQFYMTLEYVVGKDLRRILRRAKEDNMPMPLEVALYIIRDVAEGLSYAHRIITPHGVGLVHADVSPTNIVVSYEGEIKLIDFGLAQHKRETGGRPPEQGEKQAEQGLGKLAYLSPEQYRHENLDGRTDIYSTALVLYELLTGRRYREGETVEAIVTEIGSGEFRSSRTLNPRLPNAVDRILHRALEVDTDGRYESAEAFRDDLSALLSRLLPRMSRDRVGAYIRALFPAEYKAETTLTMSLFSRMPSPSLESALTDSDIEELCERWLDHDVTMPAIQMVPPVQVASVDSSSKPIHPARDDVAVSKTLPSTAEYRPVSGTEVTLPMDDTLPPFSTPWYKDTERLPKVTAEAVDAGGTTLASVKEADSRPAASATEAAPQPKQGSKGSLALIAFLALLMGAGAGGGAMFLILRGSSKEPSKAETAKEEKAGRAGTTRPSRTTAEAATPGPDAAVSRQGSAPLDASAPTVATASQIESVQKGLTKALGRQGLVPDELGIFPDLRARYDAVTSAVEQGDSEKALKALSALQKRLAQKNCSHYLKQKIKWFKKQSRSKRIPRSTRRALVRKWKARLAAAGTKGTCTVRSMALGTVVAELARTLEAGTHRQKHR